jgi:hypothetical protein
VKDYILLMHDDAVDRAAEASGQAWGDYFARLHASGRFDGGSSIGSGATYRREGAPLPLTATLGGFVRVRAASLEDARAFLVGNPVFEAGGTVEIRELTRDGE